MCVTYSFFVWIKYCVLLINVVGGLYQRQIDMLKFVRCSDIACVCSNYVLSLVQRQQVANENTSIMTTLFVSSFTHKDSACSCVVTVGKDLPTVILDTCSKRARLTGTVEIDTFNDGDKFQTRIYNLVDGLIEYESSFLHKQGQNN